MRIAEDVVAWGAALTIVGALFLGIAVAVREPIREWRGGARGQAVRLALAISAGLVVMWAASRVVP
jgi:hypothetical protein